MTLAKLVRFNRIFAHPSGRFCSVAVDHFVGYSEKLPKGLLDLPKTIAAVVEGRPDAITMQKGAAWTCWPKHAGKIPLIMQAGCFTPDERIQEVTCDPEECVRAGADAIAVAILVRGASEGRHIKILADAVSAASKCNMPVIAHIYPKKTENGKVTLMHDAENIAWCVRVGIECGVDVIKVGYTGDPQSYGQIVRTCPVPVVAAGGPKCDTLEEALVSMAGVVQSGARGATIGRNIWGQDDIPAAIRAFKSVIHDGRSPQAAVAEYNAATRGGR